MGRGSCRRYGLLVGLCVMGLVWSACSPQPAGDPAAGGAGGELIAVDEADLPDDLGEPAIDIQRITDELYFPVGLTHAGDGSNRLFLLEKGGVVLTVEDGVLHDQPFADLRDIVQASGWEQGLLGLAFHPQYPQVNAVFVSYTSQPHGDSVLARFEIESQAPLRLDEGSLQVILTIEQPDDIHNGGLIRFGPEGYLYWAVGDGGGAGDPHGNAQDPTNLLGTIMRIDVDREDSGRLYAIPPDNPFVEHPQWRAEIWAFGLRNPWQWSFDRLRGDLYIGDVGQVTREEVNLQPAGSPGGANYGWNVYEGTHRYADDDPISPAEELVFPVVEYENGEQGCAVTGGFVYRGEQIPELVGRYVFSDWCTGTLWMLNETEEGWEMEVLLETDVRVSAFGEGEDAELYLVDGAVGELHRIVRAGSE